MKKTKPTTAQLKARGWLESCLINYSSFRSLIEDLPDYDELSPLLRAGKWQEVFEAFDNAVPVPSEYVDDDFTITEMIESIRLATKELINLEATGETFADIHYESE